MSSIAEQLDDSLPFDVVVFDNEQPLLARGSVILESFKRGFETVGGRRLNKIRECAVRQAVLTFFFDSNDLHGNMPSGWIELQIIENGPAEHVGKEDVE